MSRQTLIYFGIAVGVVLILIGGSLFLNKGSHVELKGSIQKVRTIDVGKTDEGDNSIAVVDFRFVNPADFPFVVQEVKVILVDPKGREVEGVTISEIDARRLFEYYGSLGQKYNDSLRMRQKVAAKETLDRMISARFTVPESDIANRKNLIIRVHDVDGPVSDIREKP